MSVVAPITSVEYENCLQRMKELEAVETKCKKCGVMSVSFHAGHCWLCCHANNPAFGQPLRKVRIDSKADLQPWVGKTVLYSQSDKRGAKKDRGFVVRITGGKGSIPQLCIRSAQTGRTCYRSTNQVKLVKQTEVHDAQLQQTA